MSYIIQTDMSTGQSSQPLFWTGTEVVGVCRSGEARVYSSRSQAASALAAIPLNVTRFYDLHIRPKGERSRLPRLRGIRGMKGNPGYDLG